MNSIDLFRERATRTLPKRLLLQLEPFLATLLPEYEKARSAVAKYEELLERCGRYRQVRDAYERNVIRDWPAFAREQWPGIDSYFVLEEPPNQHQSSDDDDDVPW